MNFHEHGFEIIRQFIPAKVMQLITDEVDHLNVDHPGHGIRHAEQKFLSIQALLESEPLLGLAEKLLGSTPHLVRSIFFDKTPERNWLVTWHQDKTIALNQKAHVQGWGPWSIKDGSHHVQPDVSILNQMVTFRIHLDDTDRYNGCLKLIPKSHENGILSQPEIDQITKESEHYHCEVQAGDMLIMRPHLLHASSKSLRPNRRRVVHVEYSNYVLPKRLEWAS